jgi:hypothetical protein
MSPSPRPPSPTARAATQRAHRQENPNQLTSRDARILMGLPSIEGADGGKLKLDGFFDPYSPVDGNEARSAESSTSPISPNGSVPPRPPREMRGSQPAEFVSLSVHLFILWPNYTSYS